MIQSAIYNTPPLQEALIKSEQWMIRCASLVDDVSFSSTNHTRVALSLYHLCIEHHAGIHLLFDNGVIGSAFALIRLQLEAFIRGSWYYHCATENEVNLFIQGTEPPSPKHMIRDLEKSGALLDDTLERIRKEHWSYLCDYTHGGAIQVKARNSQDGITPNYKPEHVASILKASATLSLLAGVGIAIVVELDSLAIELRNGYYFIYGSDLDN